MQWRMDVLYNKGGMLTVNPHERKIIKLGCYLMPYTKINFRWIVVLYRKCNKRNLHDDIKK